jgi:PLP dependent protein
VLRRIEAACTRAGRDAGDVTLVVVTKGHEVDEIRRLVLGRGHRVLGENRVQEWRDKHDELGDEVEWHLVGHLQRNKVRYCRPFALLHSVDSERLALALSEQGQRWDHTFRVLVQVNVAGEGTKHGVAAQEAEALVDRIRALTNVEVLGLMTMAPFVDDPEQVRDVFGALARLRARLGLSELSMGMSADFEIAVEEGATLVRVGSAVFEPDGHHVAPGSGR